MEFTESLGGYRLDAQLKNVPIAFVNGLRRIMMAEIPTVVVQNVEILDNSTKMIHEMLKHRVEMLPINVRPEETAVVRDTRLELRFMVSPDMVRKEAINLTAKDIVVAGPRKDVLLADRELGTPIYFMRLQPSESIHVKASIGIVSKGASQVCVSTFRNHVEKDQADVDRKLYIENGGDPRIYDNHEIQRSYARDDAGRPYWFDLSVESIGVLKAREILKQAATILLAKATEWCKNPILREEDNWFRLETEEEGHTIGALAQIIMYDSGLVKYVSYRIEHPLLPKMIVRFQASVPPEKVLEQFKMKVAELCDIVLKSV
jgi:DNA-directed RNA polymerase subunit L